MVWTTGRPFLQLSPTDVSNSSGQAAELLCRADLPVPAAPAGLCGQRGAAWFSARLLYVKKRSGGLWGLRAVAAEVQGGSRSWWLPGASWPV